MELVAFILDELVFWVVLKSFIKMCCRTIEVAGLL